MSRYSTIHLARYLTFGVLCLGLTGCFWGDEVGHAAVDGQRITQANSEADKGNWLSHARTYDEQRYSPLVQINESNVSGLKLEWYFDTNIGRGHEASPIIVDGVMYTTTSWSKVFALDAVTGELKWSYDPKVPKSWGAYACCDVPNRGVAIWQGKVYVGTLDGRLVALNAKNGQEIWSVRTVESPEYVAQQKKEDGSRRHPPGAPYTITGAPRVVKGKVIIGNGGAEYGVRGYITAYNAESGQQEWRFYTVPGAPGEDDQEYLKKAADTWNGSWWELGGGGTVWDSMAYDPQLNLLYIGVGNGSPWNAEVRSPGGGDNLYLSSIVAINPDDGSYRWHFQTTPGDTWDYTATQHIILADLQVKGKPVKALIQAPKNGFLYILDRTNGKFIDARPYVNNLTWATGLDEDGRPIRHRSADYTKSPQLTLPSPYGGHNWQPMTYSQQTGLVYIPSHELPFVFSHDKEFEADPGRWNIGLDTKDAIPPKDPAVLGMLTSLIRGRLVAFNPSNLEEAAWSFESPFPWNGGLLSTAGNLVFQGDGLGRLRAFRASDGKVLWEADAKAGIIAPPITYEINGKQYLAVMAGYGGAFALASGLPTQLFGADPLHPLGRVLVYSLEGTSELPGTLPPVKPRLQLVEDSASDEVIAQGEQLYHASCLVCHGSGAVSGSVIPDLRFMTIDKHQKFLDVVLAGTHANSGMIAHDDLLTEEQALAIQSYLIRRTHQSLAEIEVVEPQ